MSKAKYKIKVENGTDKDGNEQFAVCYLKAMDRNILEFVLSMVAPTNGKPEYILAGEKILRSCWLDKAVVNGEEVKSDKEILDQDELLVPAAMQAFELVDIRTASLEKL